MDKETRKKLKKIQKEIDRLKGAMNKLALRPCHGDADLKQKEEDLKIILR